MTQEPTQPNRRGRRIVVAILIGFAVIGAYLGVYYAILVDRNLGTPYKLEQGVLKQGAVAVEARPMYRVAWAGTLLAPAHHVDRLLRPGHWQLREGDLLPNTLIVGPTTEYPHGWTFTIVDGATHPILIETDGIRVIRIAKVADTR